MNSRQEKTLKHIFETPTRGDIRWNEIESLLTYLGAQIKEGNGSRVRIKFRERMAVFHRPHPKPIAKKYAVENVRKFLEEVGITDE